MTSNVPDTQHKDVSTRIFKDTDDVFQDALLMEVEQCDDADEQDIRHLWDSDRELHRILQGSRQLGDGRRDELDGERRQQRPCPESREQGRDRGPRAGRDTDQRAEGQRDGRQPTEYDSPGQVGERERRGFGHASLSPNRTRMQLRRSRLGVLSRPRRPPRARKDLASTTLDGRFGPVIG